MNTAITRLFSKPSPRVRRHLRQRESYSGVPLGPDAAVEQFFVCAYVLQAAQENNAESYQKKSFSVAGRANTSMQITILAEIFT